MKAIVAERSGSADMLRLIEIEKPTPVKGKILVQIHAATVTRGDIVLRNMHPLLFIPLRLFGLRRKKIPGHEFAGEVVAVGRGVNRFKSGDRVFGTTTGLSVGANAEFANLPLDSKTNVLAKIPEGVSFEDAAAVPVGGMTALYLLKKANLQPGQKVLIYGASGSVGTYAVQLAKHYFNADVTGVCSTTNVELVKSLGADQVVDYKKDDISTIGKTFDVIFDAVGKADPAAMKKLLNESGVLVSIRTTTKEFGENLQILINLIEQGKVKPIIDRRYPLEQTAEAHRYVEAGHKKGNVVLTVIE
jgi:NADPH:quinone reductase-like Zn-dependent oxidoreductase